MGRIILNELKIKKVTLIICTIIIFISPILNLLLQNNLKEDFSMIDIQIMYSIGTFIFIYQCNIMMSSSDVRNKAFIMYKSMPVEANKFVISRYLIYCIITVVYTFIVWIISFLISNINNNIVQINLNSMLICISTSFLFIATTMPIIFKNNEKYLSHMTFIIVSIAILISKIDSMFMNRNVIKKLQSMFITQTNGCNITYLMVSIVLLLISLSISMIIYDKKMNV